MSDNSVWEHLFSEYNIIETINSSENNTFNITSNQIKEARNTYTGRQNQFEPRLLTKYDTSSSRPKIFIDNDLYILAVKNGTYRIMKNSNYIKLPNISQVPKKYPRICNSILLNLGNSESKILDNLMCNKVFDEIIGEPVICGPVYGGRHRASFSTLIGDNEITLSGVQFENDGVYETANYVVVSEVKNKVVEDFNIRQIYLSARTIYDRMVDICDKKILGLFIYKCKKNYIHIFKYEWVDINKMMDIKFVEKYTYC